jgi:aspartyl-tRNA(Asn)/glutamyl-tRNA(Gln) amidotransferase subunit C
MSVDSATVRKIASLARIAMRDDEVEAMVPELNNIIGWIEQLGEVDVTGIEPMTAVIPNTLRWRADVVNADPLTGGNIRTKILANAPAPEHGFFGVPKVIE